MTHLRFVTYDQSSVRSFPGLATGRLIDFNTSADRFVFRRKLDEHQWRDLKGELREILFRRRMTNMEAFREDRGILRAFDWQQRRQGDYGPLLYIKRAWLLESAPELFTPKNGEFVAKQLAQLPRESQHSLWERIKPRSSVEAELAFTSPAIRKKLGIDIDAILNQQIDPAAIVDQLIAALTLPKNLKSASEEARIHITGREFKATIQIVLAYLWTKEIIFFSLGLYDRLVEIGNKEHNSQTRPGSLSKVTLNPVLFSHDIVRVALERYDRYSKGKTIDLSMGAYVPWFLLSTSVREIGDLSPDLLKATRPLRVRSYKWWEELRHAYERAHGPATFPEPPRSRIGDAIRTRSLDWVLETHPELEVWTELFERHFVGDYRTYKTAEYTNARHFFRWLMAMDGSGPTPESLKKEDIRDERAKPLPRKSFRQFLDAHIAVSGNTKGKPLRSTSKSMAIRQLARVMESHRQENLSKIQKDPSLVGWLRVDNPVSELDSVWKAWAPRRTHRTALGPEIIDLAKELILMADEYGLPTFLKMRESPDCKRDWIAVDIAHKGKWPFEKEHGNGKILVWQPTRAIALFVMLEIPLRSFQVRWLDSGAGDEHVWDTVTHALVKNEKVTAEPGRSMGVFQPVSDQLLEGSDAVGLYVTTNKTQQWNPDDRSGFTIPWPSKKFYEVVDVQRRWCEFAASIFHTEPVRLSDDDLNVNGKVIDLLPLFHVLFRDASQFAGANRPISRAKIDAGWATLCELLESELISKGVAVKLVRPLGDRGKCRAYHDLHSLRVTGITNLYMKGVPVEILSKYIAGHAAIAMTLHYEVADPIEIRRRLASWVDSQHSRPTESVAESVLSLLDSDTPVSADLVRNIFGQEEINRLLNANKFAGGSISSLEVARDGQGSWTWYGDGICPGAMCSQGDESGGPVKGGPRSCGNCRFFMTGTAFLYGQAHRCNQLMFELRQLGGEREKWYRMRRNVDKDTDEWSEAEARVQELDAAIEPRLSDWWGRYQLLQKSQQLADEAGCHSEGVARNQLVGTSNSAVSMAVEKTVHFHLLKELCQSADILNMGREMTAPVLELRAMINVLMSKYGVAPFLLGVPDELERRTTTVVAEALHQLFRAHYDCSSTSAYERVQEIADATNPVIDPILAASLQKLASTMGSHLSARGADSRRRLSHDAVKSIGSF